MEELAGMHPANVSSAITDDRQWRAYGASAMIPTSFPDQQHNQEALATMEVYASSTRPMATIPPNPNMVGPLATTTTTANGNLQQLIAAYSHTTAANASPVSVAATSPLDLSIDFTLPDGQRTRPLLVDGKRLYVDEHYVSVWSPVLRSWCVECPDRELILANVQYEHVVEMLRALHPTYKDIDEQSVHILLPLAFDYQMDGLLHRCECFLIGTELPFLEKVWLADRYQLSRLLSLLLRELKPTHKLDLTGSRYFGLSDRVKVLLLERMHGSPPPEELAEPPVDMEAFLNSSDLNFAAVRAKTGRSYFVNPYYVAAWSSVFQERLCGLNVVDDIYCPCTHEELRYFLMAIYPPQLRITEANIGPILVAACKMESHGLLKKCAQILLSPQTQLSVFVRLSLLDRCKLQELLDQCLTMVHRPEHLLEMSQQQTYDCLSVKARAALMDRLSLLLQETGGVGSILGSLAPQHSCHRCKANSICQEVTWMCPECKTYSSERKTTASTISQQQHAQAMGQQQIKQQQSSSSQQYRQGSPSRGQQQTTSVQQQRQTNPSQFQHGGGVGSSMGAGQQAPASTSAKLQR